MQIARLAGMFVFLFVAVNFSNNSQIFYFLFLALAQVLLFMFVARFLESEVGLPEKSTSTSLNPLTVARDVILLIAALSFMFLAFTFGNNNQIFYFLFLALAIVMMLLLLSIILSGADFEFTKDGLLDAALLMVFGPYGVWAVAWYVAGYMMYDDYQEMDAMSRGLAGMFVFPIFSVIVGLGGLVLLGLFVLLPVALIRTLFKGDSDLWNKNWRGGPGAGP